MKRILFFIMCVACVLLLSFTAFATNQTAVTENTSETSAQVTEKTLPQVQNAVFKKSDKSTVTISWDEVAEADRYYLYYYNEKEKKFQFIAQTTDTVAVITALQSGTTYKFRVRAVSFATGQKQWGNLSEDIITVTAPEGKVKLKTKTITVNSISLYWDKLPGASGYKLFYYSRSDGKYIEYAHTKKTEITVENLSENTFYSFKIIPYRWQGDAISYGDYSDIFLECTDTSGTPRTYAQSAKAYNTMVNNVKKQQEMTVKYEKVIDTEFIMCDVENLSNTVKNTINLYDGKYTKTYKFTGGKSGNVTPTSIFEPYNQKAEIQRDDIEFFYVKKNDDGYTLRLVLKSEESFFDSENSDKKAESYYDSALSLPEYQKLDTTPLKIKKADSYIFSGAFSFIVQNGKMTYLKLNCNVLSAIDFSVATLKANTTIMYSLKEEYKIKY